MDDWKNVCKLVDELSDVIMKAQRSGNYSTAMIQGALGQVHLSFYTEAILNAGKILNPLLTVER